MKKYIISLAIFTLILSLSPAISFAEKVLFFTPTRILLDDNDRVEVMNISNLSDISRAYKISLQDLVMTYDGVTTPVDSFEHSAKRMLRFVPREFVLAPGQKQTIRIMSRISSDTPDGEYHTHVRFLEDVTKRHDINPKKNQTATISAPLAYEALIPAIISHGSVRTQIGAKDVTISKIKDSKLNIKMIATRQGNGQGIAYVDTTYITPDGKKIEATPRRTIYIYREIDERVKNIEFALPNNAAPGGSFKLSIFDNPKDGATPVKEISLPYPQ